MEVLRIVALCFSVFGILFHAIGIKLLITENNWNKQFKQGRTQGVLLLMNISISDILFSVQNIFRFFMEYYEINKLATIIAIMDVITYGIGIPFYWGMFLLTMQRFLEVYLHLRYYGCWFEKRQFLLCMTTWFVCLLFSSSLIAMCVAQVVLMKTVRSVCQVISTSLTFVVIVEFIIVYSYIFKKFRAIHCNKKNRSHNHRCYIAKRRSRIYVPFFIVMTFIVFIGIPDFISAFGAHFYSNFIYIFYYINVLSDALIYIALKPNNRGRIRRSMLRPLSSFCKSNKNGGRMDENNLMLIRHSFFSTNSPDFSEHSKINKESS